MKTIIFGVLILLISVNGYATDKKDKSAESDNSATVVLSGLVTDENSGESLVGVEVQIEGTNLKTYTDFDGKFAFKNIKPGDYKLSVNYISYKKEIQNIDLEAKKNEIKIKLQSSN